MAFRLFMLILWAALNLNHGYSDIYHIQHCLSSVPWQHCYHLPSSATDEGLQRLDVTVDTNYLRVNLMFCCEGLFCLRRPQVMEWLAGALKTSVELWRPKMQCDAMIIRRRSKSTTNSRQVSGEYMEWPHQLWKITIGCHILNTKHEAHVPKITFNCASARNGPDNYCINWATILHSSLQTLTNASTNDKNCLTSDCSAVGQSFQHALHKSKRL